MSDSNSQGGARRRRRTPRPPRNNSGGGSSSSSQGGRDSYRPTSTPRSGLQQPTGFAKFLNFISGGILCKAKPAPSRASTPAAYAQSHAKSAPRGDRPERGERGERGDRGGDRNERGGDRGDRGDSQREPRAPREPKPRREYAPVNPAEIATERLYVGNLSYDASESDLFELFNGVGAVRNAEVVVNNRTQRSKGFAFVTMGSVDEARRAVQELNGKDFMGRPLQLSGAKPLGENDGRNDEVSSESESES
jgi:hypothetical protein